MNDELTHTIHKLEKEISTHEDTHQKTDLENRKLQKIIKGLEENQRILEVQIQHNT